MAAHTETEKDRLGSRERCVAMEVVDVTTSMCGHTTCLEAHTHTKHTKTSYINRLARRWWSKTIGRDSLIFNPTQLHCPHQLIHYSFPQRSPQPPTCLATINPRETATATFQRQCRASSQGDTKPPATLTLERHRPQRTHQTTSWHQQQHLQQAQPQQQQPGQSQRHPSGRRLFC